MCLSLRRSGSIFLLLTLLQGPPYFNTTSFVFPLFVMGVCSCVCDIVEYLLASHCFSRFVVSHGRGLFFFG